MTPADSQALPPLDRIKQPYIYVPSRDTQDDYDDCKEDLECRERQLAHALKMNRLILRDSLTQKYGRNPTEEEMQLWTKIWSDAAGVKE